MITQRCQGIQETGCQPSQTAVSQRPVAFLILDQVQIHAEFLQNFANIVLRLNIQDIVAQRAAHQEFHGEVIHHLHILLLRLLSGINPGIDDLLLNRKAYRFIDLNRVRILDAYLGVQLHQFADTLSEKIFIKVITAHSVVKSQQEKYNTKGCLRYPSKTALLLYITSS